MALPATFHNDEAGAGTWQSTAGTWKRIDFAAVPMTFLPHVQSAGVDPTFAHTSQCSFAPIAAFFPAQAASLFHSSI